MNYLQTARNSATATAKFISRHRWYFLGSLVGIGILTYLFRDHIVNWAFYVRFVNSLVVLLVYIFVLFIKQARETLVPYDVYTRLRIYILTLLLIGILTQAPSVMYQGLVAVGVESAPLRNLISIIGGVNADATTILMVMVFYYRVRR